MTNDDKPKGRPASKAHANRHTGKPAGKDGRPGAKRDGKPGPKRDGKPGGKLDGKPRFAKAGNRDEAARDRPRPDRREGDRPARPSRKPADAGPVIVGDEQVPERISKIMARAGVASRRDCERLIMEGRVRLNGKVLETPAVTCTMADRIEVDGQPIRGIERTRMWLYHKPAGLVTTNSDPEGRPTVFDNLPDELPRVMSIGRLDINTEGLLLLTNDGGLARVLELPATGWLRRYRVRAHGKVEQTDLDGLRDGIAVDGVLYAGIEATLDRVQGHNVWITMGLREGKNREIKNVLGALGLDVNRLIRISYGPFQLGDIEEGHVVEVRSKMLRDQLGPRLIAEAKANFEAPILNVAAPAEDEEAPADRPARARPARGDDRAEASERPRERPAPRARDDRRHDEGDRRGRDERPRGEGRDRRFEDRPPRDRGPRKDFADRPGQDADDRPKRLPPGTTRTSNVWRAPDARPAKAGGVAERGDVTSAGKKVVVAYKEKDPDAPPPKVKAKPRKPRANRLDQEPGTRRERPARNDERPRGDKPFGKGPGKGPGRDGARDGERASGKPAGRKDGRPGGKPDGRPGGKPGGRPGGRPGGQGPGAGRNADRRR